MLLKERFINAFVDLSLISLLSFGVEKAYPSVYYERFQLIDDVMVKTESYEGIGNRDIIVSVLGLVIFILYYFLLEYFYGRTFGKFLTGTSVVKINQEPLGVKAILIRTFSRLIPFEMLSIFFSDSMWHDRWSGTRVVKTR